MVELSKAVESRAGFWRADMRDMRHNTGTNTRDKTLKTEYKREEKPCAADPGNEERDRCKTLIR